MAFRRRSKLSLAKTEKLTAPPYEDVRVDHLVNLDAEWQRPLVLGIVRESTVQDHLVRGVSN